MLTLPREFEQEVDYVSPANFFSCFYLSAILRVPFMGLIF